MSKLYSPSKVLGLYSSNVPLVINPTNKNDYYMFSAVGHYFMAYRLSDLAIIGTSDRLQETILSMSSTKNYIFCGCQTRIAAFKQAKHIFQNYFYEDKKNWKIVVALEEDGFLCGVSESNFLVIWNIASRKSIYTCQFPTGHFDVCQLIQPKNYTHKILIASQQGDMHLINYKTQTTLYKFTINKPITLLAQTPNNNVIAVGCVDGSVLIHDVLYDKGLTKVKHELGAISSISFKEGNTSEELVMLTGCVNGHVTMWNLRESECRNIGQSRDLHHGSVASLFCVPGKPWLVSNSPDNSIKVWNYDRPDGTPLLLKSRAGHWLPPSVLEYWPRDVMPQEIISGGHDSVLNVFNTREEKDNFSLGRGYLPHHGNKREDRVTREQYVLPAPCAMARSEVRDGWWDSVCVCHQGKRQVTTWSFSKRCRGAFYLDWSGFKDREHKYGGVSARTCAMSMCGNFVLVGYSSGHVIKYNIQSGKERGCYGDVSDDDSAGITGLVVGLAGSRAVVVAGSESGTLTQYSLTNQQLLTEIMMPAPITAVTMHPERTMVAVSLANGFIYLVQLAAMTVFRRFRGSRRKGGHVTDVAFCSSIERMIVADGCLLKTFDYVNEQLVDVLLMERPVTKLAMSPNDTVLVTCHENDLGLYVWSLKSVSRTVLLEALDERYEPGAVTMMPQAAVLGQGGSSGDAAVDLDVSCVIRAPSDGIDDHIRISNNLTTYSSRPSSYLANLLNVDHITVKSQMAIRGAASNTFFLPQMIETLEGIKWQRAEDEAPSTETINPLYGQSLKRKIPIDGSHKQRHTDLITVNDLARLLVGATTDEDYDKCMCVLGSLSEAAVDREVSLLHPVYHDNSNEPINAFLAMITNQVTRKRTIDVCHLYLAVWFTHNGDTLLPSHSSDRDQDDVDRHSDHYDQDQLRISAARATTMALVNEASEATRTAQCDMNRVLLQIKQMAILASHK